MSVEPQALDLTGTFLRLRGDASVEPLPVDADFWPRISRGELGSFHNEFLVTIHEFDADWPFWEMHPAGDEVVAVLSGSCILQLEAARNAREIPLGGPGRFVIVPKGAWHRATVTAPCRLMFITAGEGTQHRPI
jgi:mannose-6-phosphate isomerase-like protein (cupin superfamily)